MDTDKKPDADQSGRTPQQPSEPEPPAPDKPEQSSDPGLGEPSIKEEKQKPRIYRRKPITDEFVSNAIQYARHGRSSMELRRGIGLRTMVVAIVFCLLIAEGARRSIGDIGDGTNIFWFKVTITVILILVPVLYIYFIILIEFQSYKDRGIYKELEEKLDAYFLNDLSFNVGREFGPQIRGQKDLLKFIFVTAWAATGPIAVVVITALGSSLFVWLLGG